MSDATARAAEIGREHGETAAREWLATLPAPDLSGDYTVWNLGDDTRTTYRVNPSAPEEGFDVPDEIVSAYEDAFTAAVRETVERECREMTQ